MVCVQRISGNVLFVLNAWSKKHGTTRRGAAAMRLGNHSLQFSDSSLLAVNKA